MKNSRQSPISASAEKTRDKASKKAVEVSTPHEWKVNRTIIENNPKIDHRRLEEYEHLISASKGVIDVKKQGANYNLAHPLASKDKPTDAYHCGHKVSKSKKI